MLPTYSLLAASEDGSREATGLWVSSTATAQSSVCERLGEKIRGEEVSLGRLWRWVGLGACEWSLDGTVRLFGELWRRLGGERSTYESEAISFVVPRRTRRKRRGVKVFGVGERVGRVVVQWGTKGFISLVIWLRQGDWFFFFS